MYLPIHSQNISEACLVTDCMIEHYTHKHEITAFIHNSKTFSSNVLCLSYNNFTAVLLADNVV